MPIHKRSSQEDRALDAVHMAKHGWLVFLRSPASRAELVLSCRDHGDHRLYRESAILDDTMSDTARLFSIGVSGHGISSAQCASWSRVPNRRATLAEPRHLSRTMELSSGRAR